MWEGLLGGRGGQVVARTAAERPAGRGEDDGVDRLGAAALETLVQGRVLAVDRQEEASAVGVGSPGQLAAGDEALLVREREVDAVLEAPERRPQAGEADDGVQDEVGRGALEQLGEVAADLRERREPVDRLRPRRGGDELELRMGLDDLERLPADRAGGPEERDPSHSVEV